MQKIFGTLLIAICLFSALAIFAEFLLPKVCYYPAIIEQPIAQGRKQHRASQNNKPTNKNQQKTPSFVTAIEGVERAIRDAIPQENKSHDDWQINKDIRDLSAQERMAFEACKMYWATFGTAFLAFGGICFLWRDIAVSRKTGVDQSRAYVNVEKATIYWGRNETIPQIVVRVENSGATPAKWIEADGYTVLSKYNCEPTQIDESKLFKEPLDRWSSLTAGKYLGKTFNSLVVRNDIVAAKQQRKTHMIEFFGSVRYETFFGEVFESQFHFIGKSVRGYEFKLIPRDQFKGEIAHDSDISSDEALIPCEVGIVLKRGPARLKTYHKVK